MKAVKKLIASITHSNHAGELVKENGEIVLDAVLKDGVLKEIPILGTALNIYKAGNDIAAYFFAQKVMFFLRETEKVSEEERTEFLKKNCSNDEGVENLGEVTLMVLEKMDNPALAKMLGRAFALMMKGKLHKQNFELYTHIIKNLDPYLIRQVSAFYGNEGIMAIDGTAALLLANYGLIKTTMATGWDSVGKVNIERCAFGKEFYEKIISDDN
ncbi:hypothetical protein P3W53_26110 [Pseudomonas denitrificans (nom. rej.)]|nr:hypothetical protein [Pseudomonas denitrificans (nom. rej.)]